MRKIIFTLLLVVLGLTAKAQLSNPDFSLNNLHYKIISPNEVELIQNPTACFFYTGDIVVPDSVQHNGLYYKVTSIGSNVFYAASLSSLSLPQGIRTIREDAFIYMSLNSDIDLPDSLQTIKDYAFYGTYGIQNIYIPAATNAIATSAFSASVSLENILVDTVNQYYCSYNGVLYDKDTTELKCCPAAKRGTFNIPESVETIGKRAFHYCGFSSIIIPNTVRTISFQAFYQCENLTAIRIPVSVTFIGGGTFSGCKRLSNIIIDSSNSNYRVLDETIIYSANMDTLVSHHKATDSVFVPNGVKVIAELAMSLTKNLKVVILPEGLIDINDGAFFSSGITAIGMPQTLKTIGEDAFNSCASLTEIVIPNSVTSLGKYAFYMAGDLESVVMSDSVKVLPKEIFYYCTSLRSFTGGQSLERISNCAFGECSSLSGKMVFPETLKVIEPSAFVFTEINEVEFTGIIDTIGGSNFGNLRTLKLVNPTPPYTPKVANQVFRVVIPCGATEAYLADPKWSSYTYVEDCDGIDESEESNVRVVAKTCGIEVLNAEGCHVAIYDAVGRCLVSEGATGSSSRTYTVPTTGLYVVSIDSKGYKVVVK